MRRLAVVIIVLGLGVSQALAQPSQGRGMAAPGVQQIVMMYGDQLQLTDDQISEIISKQISYRQTMRESRMQQNRGQQGQRRNEDNRPQNMGENLRSQHSSSILNSVLNEQQREQLKSILIDRAEYGHEYRVIRNRILVETAGLSGAKAEETRAILDKHSSLMKNMRMSEIEDPGTNRTEERQQMMSEMQSDREELKSILTVDEYQNLMQLMEHRTNRRENDGRQRPFNRRQ